MPTLTEWVASLPNVVDAKSVRVKIGKYDYTGVLYGRKNKYVAHEHAVKYGGMKAGDTYVEYAIYVIGERPLTKGHNVYTWKHNLELPPYYNSVGEWYVACYFDQTVEMDMETRARYHPFGRNFMLMEWPVWKVGPYANHKIDTLERFSYKRHPMEVIYE